MSLRQATASLFRRMRFQSKIISYPRAGSRPELSASIFEKSRFDHKKGQLFWLFVSAQPALLFGISSGPVLADDASTGEPAELDVLQRIEDGSVVSNEHTIKWRIFTDQGRENFLQGKIDIAEKFFCSAIEEAKQGFGEQDPHVASSYNNLAELYRIQKLYDKAEPLYQKAIAILKETYGDEDVRVGAALHNLGQFYRVLKRLDEAQACYERALKLKGRVLGHGNSDYADTLYHLGAGKEKDAEACIQDSIRILEETGGGDSHVCLRRLRYLAQIYIKSNRLAEAEFVQRKILQTTELMKGWDTMVTVFSAESLATTLQASGKLDEAQELLERCLEVRKSLLPKNHIQIGVNMLSLGRIAMLKAHELGKRDASQATAEIERAKNYFKDSSSIAQTILDESKPKWWRRENEDFGRNAPAALVILLQSLNALGRAEINKRDSEKLEDASILEAEKTFNRCITAFKEFTEEQTSLSLPIEAKMEYLSCLKQLLSLLTEPETKNTKRSKGLKVEELEDEIKRVDLEIQSGKSS